MGISSKTLGNWMADERTGKLSGAKPLPPDQERIRELERALKIAQMEVEILKKATAYFAKSIV
jgi:transposase